MSSGSNPAELEAALKDLKEQLATVQATLDSDPNNDEFKSIKADLEVFIAETEADLAAQAPAPLPPGPEPKWRKEDHPKFRETPPSPPEEPVRQVKFEVNDTVLAKWKSGDKGFYEARITSITGSSANPVYNIAWKKFAGSETLRSDDIKPIPNDSKKRKADAPPATTASSAAPVASGNTNVISAAANINPTLASQAKREPSKVSDGPVRPPKVPRQVKAKKELEANKSNWQSFSQGKGKKFSHKESMFRTGTNPNARVGFTGSGQPMTKDPTRSRHTYQVADEE